MSETLPTLIFSLAKAFMFGLTEFFSRILVNFLSKTFLGASAGMVEWCASWLTHIDRPGKIEAVRALWTASFKIYISTLLPISLVLLGIYVMFSSEPPARSVFEGYLKRVGVATLIAYFSFPTIDALVWLTNQISQELLRAALCGGGMCSAMGTVATWSAAVSGILATLIASGGAILPFLFLIMIAVVVVIALRPIIVWLAASTMPIFCFFYIIGVGPLRKVNEVVEWIWGMAVLLPTMSVLGAAIVALMVKLDNPGTIATFGAVGLLYFFSPLILTLAFPFLVHSMMGAAGSAVARVVEGAFSHIKPTITSVGSKWVRSAVTLGGPFAAPIYLVPSRKAAKFHDFILSNKNGLERDLAVSIAKSIHDGELHFEKFSNVVRGNIVNSLKRGDVNTTKSLLSSIMGKKVGLKDAYREVLLENLEGEEDLALAIAITALGKDVGDMYKKLTRNMFLRSFLASNDIKMPEDLQKLVKEGLPYSTLYALHFNSDLEKAIENDFKNFDGLAEILSKSTGLSEEEVRQLVESGKTEDLVKKLNKELTKDLLSKKIIESLLEINSEKEAAEKLLKYLKAGGPLKVNEKSLKNLHSKVLREKIKQMGWREYIEFRFRNSDLNSTSYRATLRWWK